MVEKDGHSEEVINRLLDNISKKKKVRDEILCDAMAGVKYDPDRYASVGAWIYRHAYSPNID